MSETIAAPKTATSNNETSNYETLGDHAAEAISLTTSTIDKSVRSAGAAVTKTGEEQRKIFNEGFEQACKMRRELGAADMHALMMFAGDARGGLRELQSCLTNLVDGVIRTNLRIAQEILLVESPRAMVELQQRFLRDYFSAYERGVAALMRVANEAPRQAERLAG
jgi:hypothetical protein